VIRFKKNIPGSIQILFSTKKLRLGSNLFLNRCTCTSRQISLRAVDCSRLQLTRSK